MIARLRHPGGRLGTATVICAVGLAVLGLAGAIAMLVTLPGDSTFWSEKDSDKVAGLVCFSLSALGALGFLIMDRSRAGGAALAVVGGLAIALVLFWAVLPLILGLAAVVVAVLRARAMSSAPPAPAT